VRKDIIAITNSNNAAIRQLITKGFNDTIYNKNSCHIIKIADSIMLNIFILCKVPRVLSIFSTIEYVI
jgi:hypothetical protein